MTRDEKIAHARELRDQGFLLREIAERLGVAKSTASRWVNPEVAATQRETSRRWKANNHERFLAYCRDYRRAHPGRCAECGGATSRPDNTTCQDCVSLQRTRRGRQIEKWWADGLPLAEIADRLGWSISHVGVEIQRLRADGYDLPYRQAGRRVAA